MMIGKKHSKSGYGKLLLKTTSNSTSWIMYSLNPQKDTKWTFVGDDGNILDDGIIYAGTSGFEANLSSNTGEAILYIDVDNSGNGITYYQKRDYESAVTFLDLRILPELISLVIYNTFSDEIKIVVSDNNKIEQMYLYNVNSVSPDFINLSTKLKKMFFRYGLNFNGSLILSNKNDLSYIFIDSSVNFIDIDINDFRYLPNMYYTYLRRVTVNESDYNNFYFNPDLQEIISLYDTKGYVPQLDVEVFTKLNRLYFQNIENTSIFDIETILNSGKLPVLKYLYFIGKTNVPDVINISQDTLEYIYAKSMAGYGLVELNLSNLSNLYRVSFYGASALETFTIDSISQSSLKIINIGGYTKVINWNFSEAELTYINCNYNDMEKLNIINTNKNDLTYFSGHSYYKPTCFVVKNISDWDMSYFRDDDTLTDDEASCST